MALESVHKSRRFSVELACVIVLALVFACFTWRCVTMFFGDDDVMNMYYAWTTPALKLWKAQVLPWMPILRPMGNAVYRICYSVFGFRALPLYLFVWGILIANVFLAWRFYRALAGSGFIAVTAVSLTLVHGLFQDLYLNAGTIYDSLCFLFTALAVVVYVRVRRMDGALPFGRGVLLVALCLAAMNSKESGVTAPAILFCFECIYILPAAWREKRVTTWIRAVAPFYSVAIVIVALFVFGRVHRSASLVTTAAYQPHLNCGFWLANVAEYLGIEVYRAIHFSAAGAGLTLTVMLAIALALRNRAMIFGWLFFVIAITPVAVISIRLGYVLYVPNLGLGLYFASLIGTLMGFIPGFRRDAPQYAVGAAVAVTILWIHAAHWPAPWVVHDSAEWRIWDKMHRDYPSVRPGAKILFADDYRSDNGYDLMFHLRLLYGDPTIEVARLRGAPGQQPERPLSDFDYVFTTAMSTYVEMDRRDVEKSIELNILEDYQPGRLFDARRLDHAGYVVSGLLDFDARGAGCWTTRSTTLKFDLYPSDSRLSLKLWVPEYVASSDRRLAILVDGEDVGTVPLTKAGENDVAFAVPGGAINASGFTMLKLDVDNPYTKDGQEYGVVLMSAGFDYVSSRPAFPHGR